MPQKSLTQYIFPDNRRRAFWQYTNRMPLDGYTGKEKYSDMNVFYGTEAVFDNYAR